MLDYIIILMQDMNEVNDVIEQSRMIAKKQYCLLTGR